MNKRKGALSHGAAMVLMLCIMSTQLFADFQAMLQARWQLSLKQVKQEIATKSLQKTATFPASPGRDDHQYIWYKKDNVFEGPVDVIVRRTQALIDNIKLMSGAPSLSAEQAELNTLKGQGSTDAVFYKVCELRRKIAMKNPLLNFDEMIFSGHGSNKPQFHTQQMGWFAVPDPGNSLYKVKGFKAGNPVFTDMLETPRVTNGRFKGESLSNKNAKWLGKASVFTPEISYDASKVAFAWSMHVVASDWDWLKGKKDMAGKDMNKYSLEFKYRIFEMNMDGTNLRMLTDFGQDSVLTGKFGPNMDEYDPTYLPNGRLLWVSERHNGGQRCGNTGTSGNMYTMKLTGGKDNMGSDIVRIGFHETNERSPAVDFDGKIVYSRWDYIDRHAYSAQSMWLTSPDGTDPRVKHGNYMEDDKDESGKGLHPISECDIRPIPGQDGKYMGIAGGHHEAYWGNLCVIDVNKPAKGPGQIRWFFVGCTLPGDNWITKQYDDSRTSPSGRVFSTPYPLSESFVIVADEKEVLLLDKFRNEILLFSTADLFKAPPTEDGFVVWAHSPLPVRTRVKENVIPAVTCQGESCDSTHAQKARISLVNIYETDTPWPSQIKIKKLRICQLVPRPKKPWDTQRNQYWGWGDGALLKAVIGTVPVETDGSAYFLAPIEREIFFQAIDSTGMAVTSMLSGTYVHPGEHLTCIGCHEDKWNASSPDKRETTIAFKKGLVTITPEVSGSFPLTYARLVRDSVFIPKCLKCHQDNNVNLDFEYWDIKGWRNGRKCLTNTGDTGVCVGALEKYVTYYGAAYDKAYGHTVENMLQMGEPGNPRSRSVPMKIGARGCELLKYLSPSHHGVQLSPDQFHRATMWMDLNVQELGTYQHSDNNSILKDDQFVNMTKGDRSSFFGGPYTRQRNGEVVWPSWEGSGFDKDNPTGVQRWGDGVPPYSGNGMGYIPAARLALNGRLMVRGGQLVLTEVPVGLLEVALFNLAGRAVAQKSVKTMSEGSVNLASVKALGAGTYVARVRLNGEQVLMSTQSIAITN